MVKADSQSLEMLSSQIRNQLDQFLLKMNDIFRLQNKLESCWDAEKCGSFSEAMNTIKGSIVDVESGCKDALKEIAEMISIVRKYDSIKF